MVKTRIPNTLRRLARRLFDDEPMQQKFISSLTAPVEYPVAVVWLTSRPATNPFTTLSRPAWMPDYVDLVSIDQRPGRHELHDQGDFYCLDPSSVFMAQGLSEAPQAKTVLDVCASPGGKSVLAWRALKPGQLFSNEVIGKRLGALISNLRRCNVSPVNVVSVDPERLAKVADRTADVVLVDAPCSGQSLIARGKESPGCFHPATINMNANRQRRILSNALVTVKPGGWLIYMTCTFSLKENERNVEWLLKRNPELDAVPISNLEDYQSTLSDVPCYRLWPVQSEGAGGFVAVFKRESTEADVQPTGSLSNLDVRWNSIP